MCRASGVSSLFSETWVGPYMRALGPPHDLELQGLRMRVGAPAWQVVSMRCPSAACAREPQRGSCTCDTEALRQGMCPPGRIPSAAASSRSSRGNGRAPPGPHAKSGNNPWTGRCDSAVASGSMAASMTDPCSASGGSMGAARALGRAADMTCFVRPAGCFSAWRPLPTPSTCGRCQGVHPSCRSSTKSTALVLRRLQPMFMPS